MTEYEIVDEPPPPGRSGRRNGWVLDFVAFLQAHPGQWVKAPQLYRFNTSTANTMATTLKRHGCESLTRKVDDEHRAVYARWPA